MPNHMPRPTEGELALLSNLLHDLRGEARIYRVESRDDKGVPNPDVRAFLFGLSRDFQARANALLAVLRHAGVRGLPEPLDLDKELLSKKSSET